MPQVQKALELFILHQLEPDSMNHLALVPELNQLVHNLNLALTNYFPNCFALLLIHFALRSQNQSVQSLAQALRLAIEYPQ